MNHTYCFAVSGAAYRQIRDRDIYTDHAEAALDNYIKQQGLAPVGKMRLSHTLVLCSVSNRWVPLGEHLGEPAEYRFYYEKWGADPERIYPDGR